MMGRFRGGGGAWDEKKGGGITSEAEGSWKVEGHDSTIAIDRKLSCQSPKT